VPCGKAERRLFAAGVALVCSLFAGLAAAGELAPYRHVYHGKVSFVPVAAELVLTREEDDVWQFRSVSRTRGWAAWKKGSVDETSRFELAGEGLRPLTYAKLDGFSDRDRNVETRFEDGEVVSVYRGDTVVHAADGVVYDLLSLRLALRLDLAGDRLPPRYEVVDGRGRLRTIEVVRAGTESVRTGLGRVDAERLEYSTRSDRRYVVWFAPELEHALVRLEEHRDGRLRAWMTLYSRAGEADPRRGTRP
jgi:hypothetical protein